MSRTPISRLGEGLAAFAISLAHFAFFDPFRVPLWTDVRYFVYFAWRVSEGATPYLDLFDPKTPLSMFVGALLYQLGTWLGTDPVIAIRIGYLLLASIGGWLSFEVMRAIGGGRLSAGALGLLAYCSFGALGELPAIGNVPKLLMALGAAATGLLCMKGRFVAAGVFGALAFLDWQIGITAWFGAAAAAGVYGRPRSRAILHVALGGALGLAPFVTFFVGHGGLAAFFDQALFAAFFRGTEFSIRRSLLEHLERVGQIVARNVGSQEWLLLASGLGAVIAIVWLWTRRRTTVAPLFLVLAVYHFSIVGFSMVDFQGRGDAFAILHSAAFFLGILWIAIDEKVDSIAYRRLPEAGHWAAVGLLLMLALVVARPGPLRPKLDMVERPETLSEQREVAEKVSALVGDRRLVAVEMSEILVLLGRPNPTPFIYWNVATWHQFREFDGEEPRVALRRLLNETDADAWIVSAQPGAFEPTRIRLYGLRSMEAEWKAVDVNSDAGNYSVRVYLR